MHIDNQNTRSDTTADWKDSPSDCSFDVIMPVKDSLETARQAISAVLSAASSPTLLTVYDDNSSADNAEKLQQWALNEGWHYCAVGSFTGTPSPNYLHILQRARRKAIEQDKDMLIVESDVVVQKNTLERMLETKEHYAGKAGLIAAVTVNENNEINYPYEFAKHYTGSYIKTNKHLSFCCTLLTNEFLNECDFDSFQSDKHWYDVTISKRSLELGFDNLLLLDTPVVHYPHSSRPWKKLKYTNPLLYYWRKLWYGKDKI